MTAEDPPDFRITSAAEFEAALATLIGTAIDEDVDVRGAWEARPGVSSRDWEVEIYELSWDADD